ncbi:hypothetical protein M422DRAFT_45362 [Sphaerobolus stellatus SS14]|nr:hypothetical protein M422DRAFT_45362 [Sphaerobolus stellatus SS14]
MAPFHDMTPDVLPEIDETGDEDNANHRVLPIKVFARISDTEGVRTYYVRHGHAGHVINIAVNDDGEILSDSETIVGSDREEILSTESLSSDDDLNSESEFSCSEMDKPWRTEGCREYKRRYLLDYLELPYDHHGKISFEEIKKASVTALRYTEEGNFFSEDIPLKFFDSPIEHMAHYIDEEAYPLHIKFKETLTLDFRKQESVFPLTFSIYQINFNENYGNNAILILRHSLVFKGIENGFGLKFK